MQRKIMIGTLAGALVLGAATPAAAATRWSSAPVPVPAVANGALDAVDCADGFCVAVGAGDVAGGAQQALAEVPGDSGWVRQRVPAPSDATDTALHGVDCVSASFCVTVGESTADSTGPQSLIEIWNGRSWQVGAHAQAGYDRELLRSVSCASTSFCMAVGEIELDDVAGDGVPDGAKTLIDFWDGATWQVVGSPSPNRYSRLRGVSCPTVRFCVAVGTDGTSESTDESTQALREVLTPQGWVVRGNAGAAASTAGPETAGLYAVSCTSAAFCLDVGWTTTFTGGSHPRVDVWDGGSWTYGGIPDWPAAYLLDAVSCTATSACTVLAGTGADSVARRTQTGAWDGTSLAPTTAVPGDLVGLACTTESHCTAVGTDASPVVTVRTGTRWRAVPGVSLSGDAGSDLTAISCTSVRACLAVGTQVGPGGRPRSLAEKWDGRRWTPVDVLTPPGATFVRYAALSCASARFCVAAGSYDTTGQDYLPLLQTWDGSAWSAPSQPVHDFGFDGVSCTSATSCLVVGLTGAAQWDGTSWTLVARPDPRDDFAPSGLSCVTADDCTLVGTRYGTFPQISSATIQHWDGTSWTRVVAPPGSTSAYNRLTSVSCVAADSCVAVGYSASIGSTSLLYTWDGTKWRATPHSQHPAMLTAVSCETPGGCAAVGTGDFRALSSADGVWSDDDVFPPLGANDLASDLAAVSCVPGGPCRAVGSYRRQAGSVAFTAST